MYFSIMPNDRSAMDEALKRYQEALALRFQALDTRHGYTEAQHAADELSNLLLADEIGLASVGLGLTQDRSDIRIIVNLIDAKDVANVPGNFRGLEVSSNISGVVVAQ